jgi:hypothetical protein
MNDDGQEFTGLNYELLVEDSLRMVVRAALQITEISGLPGETHFYIAFKTGHPGVTMDNALRAQHPETITIVLQHQFADLVVGDDSFSVTLFFGGRPSTMTVPFAAVTSFNDPSVGFGLQFGADDEADNDEVARDEVAGDEMAGEKRASDKVAGDKVTRGKAAADMPDDETMASDTGGSAEVVSLDSFRKSPS